MADFAQRKSISTGAVDQLFKVLSAMDVKDQHDARLRIQQLSTVQQASKAKTFEEFITGGIKSMIPYMAQGGTPEDAMAQYAMALDVSASGDIGAEKVKQAMAMTMHSGSGKPMGRIVF